MVRQRWIELKRVPSSFMAEGTMVIELNCSDAGKWLANVPAHDSESVIPHFIGK